MSDALQDTQQFQTVPEQSIDVSLAEVEATGVPPILARGLQGLLGGLKLGQLTVTIQNNTHAVLADPEE